MGNDSSTRGKNSPSQTREQGILTTRRLGLATGPSRWWMKRRVSNSRRIITVEAAEEVVEIDWPNRRTTSTSPLRKHRCTKPLDNPSTNLARLFKKVHDSSFVRYCFYVTPLVIVILIPLLLGSLLFKQATVGGVKLYWFSIWLEIVWLTLRAGRVSFREHDAVLVRVADRFDG